MCTAGTMIGITEAASYLETTETRILMMLKKHELTGSQDVSGSWLIDKASLQLCGKPKPSDVTKTGCGGCGGH